MGVARWALLSLLLVTACGAPRVEPPTDGVAPDGGEAADFAEEPTPADAEELDGVEPPPERRAALHASADEAMRLPRRRDGHDDSDGKPLCARVDGFSLHAARTVDPGDRDGLERLCRYGLRAPFSLDRLSIDPDGQVRCRLLRPWPTPEGRTDLVLDPVVFLRRLAALVPAPYQNLVRYHGVFANRSRFRARLPAPPARAGSKVPPTPALEPTPPIPADAKVPCPVVAAKAGGHAGLPPRHLSWARLLKRVLEVDVLTCPRCNVPMVVLAFLTDPVVLQKILEHLQLPAEPPPIAPARCSFDALDPFFAEADQAQAPIAPGNARTFANGAARAPP